MALSPAPGRGTRKRRPFLSTGGRQTRRNQACTRVMWHPWHRGIWVSRESVFLRPQKTASECDTYTLRSREPSTATRVLLPTISVGKTRSSRIFSWTEVRVRLRGRFCWTREVRVGLRNIRRCATKTTWRSENFFSSSRVSLSERNQWCYCIPSDAA